MATIISSKTSGVGGLTVTGDASGILQLASADGTTAVTIDASQNVGIGTSSPGAKLQVYGGTAQYSSGIAVRSGANQYEWGHPNTAGYGSVIGAENGSGVPFIGFSCGAGTNSNTYRTYGLAGSVISSDNAGGLRFNTVVSANADNQTPVERMRIDSTGQQSSTIVGYGTYNEYKCRAWVNFNGTGTVAIRASGNISSITDNGVGNYTVNFTTAMPDANYSSVGMAGAATIALINISQNFNTYAPSTTACRYTATYADNTVFDAAYVGVSIFR